MRPVVGAVVALSLSLASPIRATDAELTWLDATGTPQWSASLEGSATAAPLRPLVVGPWRPGLPPLALESLAADREPIPSFAGKVVVLDFWASWCAPCVRTLPEIDALWRAERGRGLVVIAVNVGEPAEIAQRFAASLGLELPLARWADSDDSALAIEKLPTVIVLDREGRVRLRLDGYGSATPPSIADAARELLSGKQEPTRVLAQVLTGAAALEARWSREVEGTVGGLAAQGGSEPRIHATTGWDVFALDFEGNIRSRRRVGPGFERVWVGEHGAVAGHLIGYRSGGRRLVGIPPVGEATTRWETSAGVLDAENEPASGEHPPSLLCATTSGLEQFGLDGARIARSEWQAPVWSLSRIDGSLVALVAPGRLSWIAADLTIARELPVSPEARVLLDPLGLAPGCGLATKELVAGVVGRFTQMGGPEVALATTRSLFVIDAVTGRERFRATWPGISALARAGFDGEGRDVLVVGAGRLVSALGSAQ